MAAGPLIEGYRREVVTAVTLSDSPLIVVELDGDGRACLGMGPFVAIDADDAVKTAAGLLALLLREPVPDGGELYQ
jgi:hypothetical protein